MVSYRGPSRMMRNGVSRLLEGCNGDSEMSINLRVILTYLGQIPKDPSWELCRGNRPQNSKLWVYTQLFKEAFCDCLPQLWERASYSKKYHIVYERKHSDDFSGTGSHTRSAVVAPKLLILLDRSIEQPRLAWGAWGVSDWVFCCRCPCLGENRQILHFLGQTGFYIGKSDVIAKTFCTKV